MDSPTYKLPSRLRTATKFKADDRGAIIYARKSSKPEDRQAKSIPDQIIENKLTATRLGYDVIEIIEESRSAYELNRPKFNEVILKITKGYCQNLIVWDVSRIARNADDAGKILTLMQEGHLQKIITPHKIYTIDDKFFVYMELAMADESSRKLSINVKRGLENSAKRGNYNYGRTPLGYLKKDKLLIPDPKTYDIVKRMFLLFLHKEYKSIDLVKYLQDFSVRGTKGRLITKGRVSEILHNAKFYAGYVKYADKDYVGLHKPIAILSDDQAQKILSMLRGHNNNLAKKNGVNPVMILNQTLVCPKCYKTLTGYITKNHKYYKCRTIGCGINIKGADIEEEWMQRIAQIEISKENVVNIRQMIMSKLTENGLSYEVTLRHKKIRLLDLEKQLITVQDLFIEGRIDRVRFESKTLDIKEQIDKTAKELRAIDFQSVNVNIVLESSMNFLSNLRKIYEIAEINNKLKINRLLSPDGIMVLQKKKFVKHLS
jgi:site-specific DNA recombinase